MYKSTCRILWARLSEFWTMSYCFFLLMPKRANNYLKVTNLERNEGVLSTLKVDKLIFLVILVHGKKSRLICNFDPTPRGRNENKWTPHYQTELDRESKRNNRFATRDRFAVLRKNDS